MIDKRGSKYAKELTLTPTKTTQARPSFSPSQDPPQLTPGKSPVLETRLFQHF